MAYFLFRWQAYQRSEMVVLYPLHCVSQADRADCAWNSVSLVAGDKLGVVIRNNVCRFSPYFMGNKSHVATPQFNNVWHILICRMSAIGHRSPACPCRRLFSYVEWRKGSKQYHNLPQPGWILVLLLCDCLSLGFHSLSWRTGGLDGWLCLFSLDFQFKRNENNFQSINRI